MVEARRILQTLIDLTFPIPIVVIGVWFVRALFNAREGYTSKELLLGAAKVGAGVAVFVSIIFFNIESEDIARVLRVHPALGIPAGLSAVLGLACLGLTVYFRRKEAARGSVFSMQVIPTTGRMFWLPVWCGGYSSRGAQQALAGFSGCG